MHSKHDSAHPIITVQQRSSFTISIGGDACDDIGGAGTYAVVKQLTESGNSVTTALDL